MKKVLSIALAIVMVLSVSVVAFADDEVIWSEDTLFFTAGNWADYTLEDGDGLLEALQVEGAVLVITRDAESGVTGGGTSDSYENFILIDSWYVCNPYVWLGTAGHTAADEPSKEGLIDCLSDDGLVVTYDAATVYAAYEAGGALDGGSPIIIINTSAEGAYKVTNISVVVPETTEEEAVEDVNASEETTEEASESTETSTASSPDTGVALALVPMAIAGFAVVSSKRR
ncbi:MAG: hypothetical protein LUG23_08995 [Oscillospiraceae bacterium]|nr:hypothetical protein [Oscillospiraceae bacterium]